jgi:hypothetical protein
MFNVSTFLGTTCSVSLSNFSLSFMFGTTCVPTQPQQNGIIYSYAGTSFILTYAGEQFLVLLFFVCYMFLFQGSVQPFSYSASEVYGQLQSFSTADCGAVSKDSLHNPYRVAFHASGNVYIADKLNNRVLRFDTSTSASGVYGQAGLFTTNAANSGGISASSLSTPVGVTVDSGL